MAESGRLAPTGQGRPDGRCSAISAVHEHPRQPRNRVEMRHSRFARPMVPIFGTSHLPAWSQTTRHCAYFSAPARRSTGNGVSFSSEVDARRLLSVSPGEIIARIRVRTNVRLVARPAG